MCTGECVFNSKWEWGHNVFKDNIGFPPKNCSNAEIITVINSVRLAVRSLHSSWAHAWTSTVGTRRGVRKRISFSIIKTATSWVYIISEECAASVSPAALLGRAKEKTYNSLYLGMWKLAFTMVMWWVSNTPQRYKSVCVCVCVCVL